MKDNIPTDILVAWQRLFEAHKKNGMELPIEVWFKKLPDLYNPILRQAEYPDRHISHISYVFGSNECRFMEQGDYVNSNPNQEYIFVINEIVNSGTVEVCACLTQAKAEETLHRLTREGRNVAMLGIKIQR